jgi:ABC-type sulfate/molybdate transport systems ATPase subunit
MERPAQYRRRGVDPQSRNAILGNIEALGGEGEAVLYTTHYMEEAERLCDRVGIIDQGRPVAEGPRRELVARAGERDRIELTAGGHLFPQAWAMDAFITLIARNTAWGIVRELAVLAAYRRRAAGVGPLAPAEDAGRLVR